jgi:hypothetical protein
MPPQIEGLDYKSIADVALEPPEPIVHALRELTIVSVAGRRKPHCWSLRTYATNRHAIDATQLQSDATERVSERPLWAGNLR